MQGGKVTTLTLSRTGGVAGIRPPARVLRLEEAPANVADRAATLLAAAGFFSLPAELPNRSKCADVFQYMLTVTCEDGRSHSVVFTEMDASGPLKELKRFVRDASV